MINLDSIKKIYGINVIKSIDDMYLGGMSLPDIARETGKPISTARLRLKKKGLLRARGEAVRLAAEQGKVRRGKGRIKFYNFTN